MKEILLTENDPPKSLWINLKNPSDKEMEDVAIEFGLHPELVRDCLGPFHLPKHEINNDITFMILRSYDENSRPGDSTVQDMTKKVAFFLGNRFLISFHRLDHSFLYSMAEEYKNRPENEIYLQELVLRLMQGAINSYEEPLDWMEDLCQKFESKVLQGGLDLDWVDVFRTKSRLMTIKRILLHTRGAIYKFVPYHEAHLPLHHDIKDQIERFMFLCDTLTDDLSSLLNIQMSLASNRTNEVMRVLTVFSVFFLPLTFIVGVYGMNFHRMPELNATWGYPTVWIVMVIITIGIYAWFKRRHWL